MQKYYVVHTKPNQENKAVINLKRQGFKTWLPSFKKTIFFKNKKTEKKVAFFPGYIFVILDVLNDDWSKIQNTFGVKYLIQCITICSSKGMTKEEKNEKK